jgi:hypothetical protein
VSRPAAQPIHVDGMPARAAGDARRVPATVVYAALVLATTVAVRDLAPAWRERLLAASSTNVANLTRAPVRVLVASAFWLQGRPIVVWMGMLVVAMALTERWIGTRRTIAVLAGGHVGATVLTQAAVATAVAAGWMSRASLHMPDVGISYGLAALAGALALRFNGRVRVAHVALALGVILIFLIFDPGVGNVGHVVAFGLGLAIAAGFRHHDAAGATRGLLTERR